MKTVYLVATRHDYQRLGNPGSGQFRTFIAAACQELTIRAIVKEVKVVIKNSFDGTPQLVGRVEKLVTRLLELVEQPTRSIPIRVR